MNKIAVLLILTSLTSCCFWSNQTEKPSEQEMVIYKKDSAQVIQARSKLLAAFKQSLSQLDSLSPKQKEALAVVLLINAEVSGLSVGDHRKDEYKKQVAQAVNDFFHQPLITAVDYKNSCLQDEIAYARALAQCEKDGESEENCPDAWAASNASMNCAMRDIEARLAQVKDLLRGGNPIPN